MKTIRSVYMMTDLEGVAGVDDWDPRHYEYANQAKGVYDRSEVQRLLTAEVNAAAQGLFDAGVELVVINDGHGAGRTILVEELISGVRIVRGKDRPGPVPCLSREFDAVVQVGMHAMSQTPNATLGHTMGRSVRHYRVNGKPIGEMQVVAYLAGELGVPMIYTSGDDLACQEIEQWIPNITTTAVKQCLGVTSANHLAPVDARRLIRQDIARSVSRADQVSPLTLPPGPVDLTIEMVEPVTEISRLAQRVDDCTYRYTGSTFWQAYGKVFGREDTPIPA